MATPRHGDGLLDGPVRTKRKAGGGFTLLEVMIALAVLAMSLTWLIEASMRAVDAENHARMLTTATFLARQVMVDLEDELQEKGMQDDAFSSEKTGEFEQEAYKRFSWRRVVDKIELPGQDVLQTAIGGLMGLGGGSPGSGGSPTDSPLGAAGAQLGSLGGGSTGGTANLLTSQFGIIKDVLESGIRRATIRVVWSEHGIEKSVELNQYLTDPKRVDQAVALPNLAGGATGPTGSATGPGIPGLPTSLKTQ